MVYVKATIDGIKVDAFVDTGAATNVITRPLAYKVYLNGQAVFREGASELLRLTAFGGHHVPLYETFFAARVNLKGKEFDQLFFIVDTEQHEVLFGLPAITAAGMHLTTADGEELLPDPSESLTLDLGGTGPMPKPTLAKVLNDVAIAYRNHTSGDIKKDVDPYDVLRFSDYGPAVQNEQSDESSEADDLDCVELDNTGEEELGVNELGDDCRASGREQVFAPNVFWRASGNLVGRTDWKNPGMSTTVDASLVDVRMQQAFANANLEPPSKVHTEVPLPSATFNTKQPAMSEQQKEPDPTAGSMNWLTIAKGKFVPSHFRSCVKCNFLSAKVNPQQLLLISGSSACKVTAVESVVERDGQKHQWLMVENHMQSTVHVKKGERVAFTTPLEEVYDVPEEFVRQANVTQVEEVVETKENALPSSGLGCLDNNMTYRAKPLSLSETERRKKLAEDVKFTNLSLTQHQTKVATNLLLENNDCFSVEPGELGHVRGIEVEIETGDYRPIRQNARCTPYHVRDDVKKEIEKLLKIAVIRESNSPWASPIVAVC